MNDFTIEERYELGRTTQRFIKLLRERENNKKEGKPYLSDNDLLYLIQTEAEPKFLEETKKKSYVGNEYFVKNYEKYKVTPENSEEKRIFPEMNPEEFNSPPIFKDSIIAGYFYCAIRNRLRKFGYYFGVLEE